MNYKVILIIFVMLLLATPVIADEPTEQERTINTVSLLSRSVVHISGYKSGTGFYIAPNTILTNYHIVHVSAQIVKFTTSNGLECEARIGYREEGTDLALLHTDCTSEYLTFSNQYQVGQDLITYGNPINFPFTASKGILSSDRGKWIQFDAKSNHGSSGSPVANLDGEIIGILTMKAKSSNYMAFAIKSEDIKKFLERSK